MIQSLHLQNFTCFTDNEFHFSEGINVFIGENGTGKTHLLKVLACLLEINNKIAFAEKNPTSKLQHDLYNIDAELNAYFKEFTNKLYKHGKSTMGLNLCVNNDKLGFNINTGNSTKALNYFEALSQKAKKIPFVYVLPREILSIYQSFLSEGIFARYQSGFDETYFALARALERPLLRGNSEEIREFSKELSNILEGEIIKDDFSQNFHLKTVQATIPIHLIAEGLRKIAMITYLFWNGSLSLHSKSVLLIDEPEANLNPKLIESMAKFLIKLAENGVQIFLATHDYLLSSYLSLYSQENNICYFGLSKNQGDIRVETAKKFTSLQNNIILDEFSRYYDVKANFFNAQVK